MNQHSNLEYDAATARQSTRWAGGHVTRREIWPVPPVPFTFDNRIDDRALDELVEFYAAARVDGLFILAYSGEIFELSCEEQTAICRRVISRIAGRLPIAVAAHVGGGLEEQVLQLQRIAELGPHASIVFLSTLPHRDDLLGDLATIAEQIDAPLGVYECPAPEHRLLSPQEVSMLASSGQFVFMKETSRNQQLHREKLVAARGTHLKIYQANWQEMPRSLDAGCPGFCGVIANMFPELVDAFCNSDSLSPVGRQALHEILADALTCVAERHYPATLKYVLRKRGLSLSTISRINGSHVDAEDARRLDEMLDQLSLLRSTEELLSFVSKRTDDGRDATLRGPHRPRWTRRTLSANSPEID